MATFNMVDLISGTTEQPVYGATGQIDVVWQAALPSTLTVNDVINGPVLPAGTWITGLVIDTDSLDSNVSKTAAFQVGFQGTPGAFIASGNTTARAGGIQIPNVGGTIGFTAATNTRVIVTMTTAPATGLAGTMRMRLSYTANP